MSNSPVSVPPLPRARARRTAQLAWVLVASLVVTLLGAVASPANALGSSISGTVTGESGATTVPLANVQVTAIGIVNTFPFFPEFSATTNASGAYTISVPAGNYTLRFTPPAGSMHVAEYWNDKTRGSADLLTVESFVPVTGLATTLSLANSIAGNVKGIANSNVVSAVVSLYTVNGDFVASAMTDDSGNYVLVGLAAGNYKLRFGPPIGTGYIAEWWDNKSSLALADTVTVSGGVAATGKNAVLGAEATITGNVKNTSGTNLAGVRVDARNVWRTFVSPPSTTDADGNYSISGLAGGSYTLYFNGTEQNYVAQWWNNKPTEATAQWTITVNEGHTAVGRDAVLEAGASISGNVKGCCPVVNLNGVTVFAIGSTSAIPVGSAITSGDGDYTIKGLPAGSYTLHFVPAPFSADYPFNSFGVSEYWNAKQSLATADYFPVGAGNTVTNMHATLEPGGTIQGRLTDSLGSPINGVALLYSATDTSASQAGSYLGRAVVSVDQSGLAASYAFPGLPVGSYRVAFTDGSTGGVVDIGLPPSNPYVSEWWSNKYSFAAATSALVTTPGQRVEEINGTLENPRFADVGDPSSTFYPFIEWMASAGISTGTVQPSGKPLYKPADAVSRQAMALFMYRLSEETFTPPVTATFADVATTSQFYTAIEWMAARGISAGTAQPVGKPLFKPSAPVSRQAMALFVARYASANLTVAPTTQRFADVPLGASSAAAINWMFVNGISTGSAQPSGLPLYKPSDPVTRQAMAAFLFRVNALSPTP